MPKKPGLLHKTKKPAGVTPSQPTAARVDPVKQREQELDNIRQLFLTGEYARTLTRALSPGGDTKELEQLLTNDQRFSRFASYHNPQKAHEYADELAGLGVVDKLLDQSTKAGSDERITDLGFNSNGFLTVETNTRKFTYGNKPGQPKITRTYMEGLIRRMAQQDGYDGTSFDKNAPLLNAANREKYLRISANHEVTAPYGLTVSIRVASPYLALTKKNFNNFAPMTKQLNAYRLFEILIKAHCNIMLSAETGAGKTEFQKMLVSFIPFQDRIVMIEDTPETHLPELYPDKDIYSWTTIEGKISISDLVKQALRNNPKWLIVAETRGAEAYEMFQGVKSDHSIITTLHAISNDAVPSRFIGMAKMGFEVNEENEERDFLRYMHIGVHLTKKVIDGHVYRYADEIAEFVPRSKEHPLGVNVLLHQHLRQDGVREIWTGRPTKDLQRRIYNETDHTLTEDLWPQLGDEDHPLQEQLYDMKKH